MLTAEGIETGLERFAGGSEHIHRVSWCGPIYGTDGVRWLIDNAECFWFVSIIASYQFNGEGEEGMDDPFQIWEFTRRGDGGEVVGSRDDGERKIPVIRQQIDLTDFPLDHIKLWCVEGHDGDRPYRVIMLPSEY